MLLKKERDEIVLYGKKLITSGLVKGTGGNLSIFNRELKLIAISPSGIDYFDTKVEDVVVMDISGVIIEGDKQPSSEYEMHRVFYSRRDDIDAIVHTHSIFATTIAALNLNLPAAHYMIAAAGQDVKCAKYATFGTKQLAENAFEAMKNRKAVLLANHGLLAGSKSLSNAFNIAEQVEYCAEIFYRAKSIGEPVILPEDEMDRMMDKFHNYGQRK